MSDIIKRWLEIANREIGSFKNPDILYNRMVALNNTGLLKIEETEQYVVAYIIDYDLLGNKSLMEIFIYILPEHRGLKNLYSILEFLETEAYNEDCKNIKIGSNIGYNDQGFIKLLERRGYITDTVSKEI